MNQWLKCLPHKLEIRVQISRSHINTRWPWWQSAFKPQKAKREFSEQASETRHIIQLWVWLRAPASANKVEERSTLGFHMPVHTCVPPHIETHTYAHENEKRIYINSFKSSFVLVEILSVQSVAHTSWLQVSIRSCLVFVSDIIYLSSLSPAELCVCKSTKPAAILLLKNYHWNGCLGFIPGFSYGKCFSFPLLTTT